MIYAELKNRFPDAEQSQLESLEAYLYFGWRITGVGDSDSIEIEREHQSGYIRPDGVFRYS